MNSLRDLNETVGLMQPRDIYELTPKELDYMLAGGYQRRFNQLRDRRFIDMNVARPVMLVEKADESQLNQFMNEYQKNISAITDDELRAKQQAEKDRQKLFAKMFIYKKGR